MDTANHEGDNPNPPSITFGRAKELLNGLKTDYKATRETLMATLENIEANPVELAGYNMRN